MCEFRGGLESTKALVWADEHGSDPSGGAPLDANVWIRSAKSGWNVLQRQTQYVLITALYAHCPFRAVLLADIPPCKSSIQGDTPPPSITQDIQLGKNSNQGCPPTPPRTQTSHPARAEFREVNTSATTHLPALWLASVLHSAPPALWLESSLVHTCNHAIIAECWSSAPPVLSLASNLYLQPVYPSTVLKLFG